jgi:glycosyltransferase involved in cell wall biosynthesis
MTDRNSKVEIVLMDMSIVDNTSGVDRYLELLTDGLKAYTHISVCWIHLVHDNSMLYHTEEKTGALLKITIPLPQNSNAIIREAYWFNKINEQIFRICSPVLSRLSNPIIHIHTLNLIDLALYIKQKIPCRIITHLHCIPWKDLYNRDIPRFNRLYADAYLNDGVKKMPEHFAVNYNEIQSYQAADHIICVTQCAKDLLTGTMRIMADKISVITHGFRDYYQAPSNSIPVSSNRNVNKLMYVGILTKSKGLFTILDAMRIVQSKGYKVRLTVAGKHTQQQRNIILSDYADLSLDIVGCVPFARLQELYRESDIGVIASLQEQLGFVAVEMAMFGLPVYHKTEGGL